MHTRLTRGAATLAALTLLLAASSIVSCSTDLGDDIVVTGTVVYVPIEGGFYGIKGDDGQSYDPMNLPAEFRKDGLRVRFEGKMIKEGVSYHMWGTVIQIVHIEAL